MKAKEVDTDQHRPEGIDGKVQRLAFRLQDFMPPFVAMPCNGGGEKKATVGLRPTLTAPSVI
jgi:hypothetical protein